MPEDGEIMAEEQKPLSSDAKFLYPKLQPDDYGPKISLPRDGMSLIPDEVLVSILSLLNFKEATATTRVARRWRYLHGWIRKLDLDSTESLCNLLRLFYTKDPLMQISRIEFKQRYTDLTDKYIRWVESVVANYKSSTLEEFRLLYTLDESHTDLIDSWLRFAVSKKVEKLELNLTPHECYELERYTFPYKNGSEFRFIRKLCIAWVNVSGDVVSSFLRNCPQLEHLSVTESRDLSSMEIINTFPSFKRLDISDCFNLESVVIRDSNLVVLKVLLKIYVERIHQFVVRNVPLLTEIWTSDISLYLFSTVLPQIEMLRLYTVYRNRRERREDEARSLGAHDMSNLKQLVVVDGYAHNASLRYLFNFLKRSHGLERFVLEAPVYYDGSGASKENIPDQLRPIIPRLIQYPRLKEVKLVGNGYSSRQFELVMHFVETAGVALKNIVVDPRVLERPVLFLGCKWDDFIRQTQISKRALEMACALQSILPSTITLTILN